MRSMVKAQVEKLLAGTAVPVFWRGERRKSVAILAYHNVVPAGDPPTGDVSLHLPLDAFRAHLDLVEEYFQVVPLSRLLDREMESGRPRVAITFDDAYRGALELGIGELLARGHPATVFVCPGLFGAPGFWWDLLAEAGGRGLPAQVRQHALSHLEGSQEEILRWASSRGRTSQNMEDHYRPATEVEVASLGDEALVTLGSHTWSHAALASVSPERAKEELVKPVAWLEGVGGSPGIIGYPYGSIDERATDLVQEAGYRMGFMIEGGPASPAALRSHPLSIPRINVPRGLSPEGLLLRATGTWTG